MRRVITGAFYCKTRNASDSSRGAAAECSPGRKARGLEFGHFGKREAECMAAYSENSPPCQRRG